MMPFNQSNILFSPSPDEGVEFLEESKLFDCTSLILGKAHVLYHGRAASNFEQKEAADSIVISKPSGTFLVHQRENTKPKNWQPQGADITFELTDEDDLIAAATRTITQSGEEIEELVAVVFTQIHTIISFSMSAPAEKVVHGKEKDMQQQLSANPEVIEKGLEYIGKEKKLDVGGNIDIFCRDENENLVAMELKRRKANVDAVRQVKGYVEELRSDTDENARGILVSPSMSSGAEDYISQYEYLKHVPMEPTVDVDFESLKDELFN